MLLLAHEAQGGPGSKRCIEFFRFDDMIDFFFRKKSFSFCFMLRMLVSHAMNSSTMG